MAIPIVKNWEHYFTDPHEGLGSTYERFVINKLLFYITKQYDIHTVLETPSFGFTGLSGINSLGLALEGVTTTINDHDPHRLQLIKEIWSHFDTPAKIELLENYCTLPYETQYFDMSWSFSAIWFVSDLQKYISELDRVTKKVILIMVPNTTGLGYKLQKSSGKDTLKQWLHEEYIQLENFTSILSKLGWTLAQNGYIDCPLWPDIGTSKEAFLKKIHLLWLYNFLTPQKVEKKMLSILSYYDKTDLQLQNKMSRLEFFEKYLPSFLKRYWAHHKFFIFRRDTIYGVRNKSL